jgi:hypothetical protein
MGRVKLAERIGVMKGFEALVDIVAELGDVDVGEVGWVGFELAESGGEEAGGAEAVLAAEVMHGDGGLDEGLQEELFGLGGGEPDALPGFVGGEEFGGVVVVEAVGERAVGPVEGHVFGRRERTTEILSEEPLRMTALSWATEAAVSPANLGGCFDMIFDPARRVGDEAHCGCNMRVTMITA